jgi:hypothetical protein
MATPMTVGAFRESMALALGDAVIARWPLCDVSGCPAPCDDSSHAADKQIVRDYELAAKVLQSVTDDEIAGLLDRLHLAAASPRSSDEPTALRRARRDHPSARQSRPRFHTITPESATKAASSHGPWPALPLSKATKLLIRVRAGKGDRRNARCEACGKWLGSEGGACQPRTLQCADGGSPADLDSPANGTLLCDTPPKSCYGRCDGRDFDMAVAGFWLGPDEDPALTPIEWHGTGQAGLTRWLGSDGTYQNEPPSRSPGQAS